MWLSQFSEYLFFLLETITIVVAILLVISGIFAIASKGKNTKKGKLMVSALHKQYKDRRHALESEIYEKKELKEALKIEKKTAKQHKQESKQLDHAKRLFVIDFTGDIRAQEVESLREEVSALLQVAKSDDHVLVRVESPGGVVNGYGLAASQLARIRDKGLHLTVSVDKVAASGGYMMASVADRIVAAPFAILGSIGVVAQLPNLNRMLDHKGVDVELHTAGKYKRTLTMLGKNTEAGREKFKKDLEAIQVLFKEHIAQYRPTLNIEQVATGEYWFAKDALRLNLVDAIETSDDLLLDCYEREQMDIYKIEYTIKKGRFHKVAANMHNAMYRISHYAPNRII